ncbi:shikimate dehydrogenase [Thalassotalea sp. HSM 43]|uniref:shikimate dehydrogenase n=1 Tax=Thalassotalea sp. HSM 43 TaxID=2552945 RepID=UPI001081CAD3|nr:shikimate dehydrogenase [Thalassotalea sp. HSM 43]QBY04445.1 shikimate dehydrogenase [Thalassotalea sp. HSM 43]
MDKYLVFGNPIEQSKSPIIHQQFASTCDQRIDYQKQLSEPDTFVADVNTFIAHGGKGANVTAPFKEQAMQMCDQLSVDAQAAGAVNTLSFTDGGILGDNTDGRGLVDDLLAHNVTLTGARILLMGAGGASRGVISPLLAQNPDSLAIVNRTLSKAQLLVDHFQHDKLTAIDYSQTQSKRFDVIINATSASLSATLPDLASSAVVDAVCYDMVYGAELTAFLKWCQQQGARQIIDGLGMLVGQAAQSFAIWHGVKPDVAPVLALLRQQFKEG